MSVRKCRSGPGGPTPRARQRPGDIARPSPAPPALTCWRWPVAARPLARPPARGHWGLPGRGSPGRQPPRAQAPPSRLPARGAGTFRVVTKPGTAGLALRAPPPHRLSGGPRAGRRAPLGPRTAPTWRAQRVPVAPRRPALHPTARGRPYLPLACTRRLQLPPPTPRERARRALLPLGDPVATVQCSWTQPAPGPLGGGEGLKRRPRAAFTARVPGTGGVSREGAKGMRRGG